MPKRIKVTVVQLERDPHEQYLLITDPVVKVIINGHKETVSGGIPGEPCAFVGETLNFVPKPLYFPYDEGQDVPMMKIFVEDTDPHGEPLITASGEFPAEPGMYTWQDLLINESVLDLEHRDVPRHLGIDVKVEYEQMEAEMKASDYDDGIPEEGTEEQQGSDSDGEQEDEGPLNYMKINVLGIRDLKNEGRQPKETESYVVVKHGKTTKKTLVVKNTLDPMYCYCFYFPLKPKKEQDAEGKEDAKGKEDVIYLAESVVFEVKDRRWGIGDAGHKLLARVTMPAAELQTFLDVKVSKTYTENFDLVPVDLEKGSCRNVDIDAGVLTVEFLPVHLGQDNIDDMADAIEHGGEMEGIESDHDSDAESDDGTVDASLENKEAEEHDEEMKKREEEADKRKKADREKMEQELKALQDITIEPGDYTITVHIIEVRGLQAGKDEAPDPVVRVRAWDQKKSTDIKKDMSSAYFDQQLMFNLVGMDTAALMEGIIRVECWDAGENMFQTNEMIGAWQTDFDFIYYQDKHEYYRRWIPLMGKSGKGGVSGYMQLSVSILGPGDNPVFHDRKKEKEEELKRMQQEGGGLKVDMPITKQELNFLVATIYRAEDLPCADNSLVDGKGIDAFFKVSFGDCEPQETKVKRADWKEGEDLKCTFREEMWIPFLSPCMSSRIEIQLFDKEKLGAPAELVASCESLHLDMVENYPELFKRRWVNLYGAPDIGKNISRVARAKKMNKAAESASVYKGKVLLSLWIDDNKPSQVRGKDGKLKARRKKKNKAIIKSLKGTVHAPTVPRRFYGLRFKIYLASEMPCEKKFWPKFQIEVSIGKYFIATGIVKAEQGVCQFDPNETHQMMDLYLPTDLTMLPDIYIYLNRHSDIPGYQPEKASFLRLDPKTEYERAVNEKPKWYELQEDPVLDAIPKGMHPGMVLMDLEFSTREILESGRMDEAHQETRQIPHIARIFVFQGRNLPASDEDGSLDPYVRVHFAGQAVKTKVKSDNKNPDWFECFEIKCNLYADHDIMPLMIFQVMDKDTFGSDEHVGSHRLPMANDMVHYVLASNLGEDEWKPLDFAQWMNLGKEQQGDVSGELLVSVQLIAVDDESVTLPPMPTPEEIAPEKTTKYLEFISVGCRDLQTVNPLGLKKPFMRFVLGDEVIHHTEPSCLPSSSDPNFRHGTDPIDYKIVPVELPKNPVFAPALSIECRDRIFGGFQEPLIGSTYIPLEDRIEFGLNGERNPTYIKFRKPAAGNPFLDHELEYSKARQRLMSERRSKSKSLSKAEAEKKKKEKASKGSSVGASFEKKTETEEGLHQDDLGSAFEFDAESVEKSIPPWLKGREDWNVSWEEKLGGKVPFERFTLYIGTAGLGSSNTRKKTGLFKGIIRVLEQERSNTMSFIKSLQKPVNLQCRLYVLQGMSLMAKDMDTNSSDPYLLVSLGNSVLGSRDNAQYNTTNPYFYERFDFATTLPGTSQIKLAVWDRDMVIDEHIGETIIDLEDRWYNDAWQKFQGLRPVERRNLWSPSATSGQGLVTCWLDIYDRDQARQHPPITIAPPVNAEYEIRMVVWKTENIPNGDEQEETSDMYVVVQFGTDPQNVATTDTHFKAENGIGSFNYRMKFFTKLPVRQEGASNLKIQVWDYDLFGENDCICESNFNFEIPLKKAVMDQHIQKEGFKVFKSERQLAEIREREAAAAPSTYSYTSAILGTVGGALSASASPRAGRKEGVANETSVSESASLITKQPGSIKKKVTISPRATPPMSPMSPRSRQSSRSQHNTGERKKKKSKRSASLWDKLKEQTGMGPDPDWSKWLPLEPTVNYMNQVNKDKQPRILVSVEILKKEVAEKIPAGLGRDEPNANPFMPPPKGRIDFTKMMNPFYLISTMCGTQSAAKLYCACIIVVGIVVMVTVGPLFLESAMFLMDLPTWLDIIILVGIVCCCCYGGKSVVGDCASFCGCDDPCENFKLCGLKKSGDNNA